MKVFSKVTFSTLLLILSPSVVSASSVIDNFISESTIESTSPDISSLYQENNYYPNYIEKARVSIQHSHFSEIERDYAIRLYTKGFSEVENEEAQFAIKKELSLTKKSIDNMRILKERYNILIEALYQRTLLNLIDKEITLQQKNLTIAKMQVAKESDVMDIYDVKETINNLKLQRFKRQQKYQTLLRKIQYTLQLNDIKTIQREFDTQWFLNTSKVISFISQNIKNKGNSDTENSPQFRNNAYKLALAKRKVEAVEIADQIKLDNIELKYDDSKKRKNALSFGFAIEIPIAKDNTKRFDEKLKLLSLKQKINASKRIFIHKISEIKTDLQNTIAYYETVQSQIKPARLSRARSDYAVKLLLKNKKRNLRLEKEKTKTLYQIMQQYITLLYLSGNLENSGFKHILKNTEVR